MGDINYNDEAASELANNHVLDEISNKAQLKANLDHLYKIINSLIKYEETANKEGYSSELSSLLSKLKSAASKLDYIITNLMN
jgi:hypothetical protein